MPGYPKSSRNWSLILALAFGLAFSHPVQAQFRPKAKQGILNNKQRKGKGAPAGALLDQFLAMTPEQRAQALARLQPARRRQILERLRLLELLSDEEREALRGRYQLFLNIAPARRPLVRGELRQLRLLDSEQRRARLNDPVIRGQFREEELELLDQVAGDSEDQ